MIYIIHIINNKCHVIINVFKNVILSNVYSSLPSIMHESFALSYDSDP